MRRPIDPAVIADASPLPATLDWHPAAYGDACADFYDQIYGRVPRAQLDVLIRLAAGGRTLELGSATGRVAAALCSAGVGDYIGVESSVAMIAAMRAKPACRGMDIIHGDFSGCALPGRFELVFALVSTFQLLPSAEYQAAAFVHLARHLKPGGTLLLECFDAPAAEDRDRSHVSRHRIVTRSGERDYPVVAYHSTRGTLDAMAGAAGLYLAARWADWQQHPDAGGLGHISLYRLP